MPGKIRIQAGSHSVEADLNDSATAKALWEALPMKAQAQTWGEEIYFPIPLAAKAEATARAKMAVGEIAYWPPGKAFCIFFGRTPASSGPEPEAASPVNPLGRLREVPKWLWEVDSGSSVMISRTEGL